MEFDVFLSHNSKDKPAVRELSRRLVERNIRVWLDEDQLIPGRNWQPLLEQGIAESKTGAVLVGKDGLGPWVDEEMQALLRQAASDGKPVIPVLLPRAPKKPELPLFLTNRTWADLRGGFTDQGLDKLVWGITGTPSGAAPAALERRMSRRLWVLALGALAAVLLIVLTIIWMRAVPEQVLAGTVRDEAGNPIAGVEISLSAYDISTLTNRLGHFALWVQAPYQANVELLARARGYETRRQHVMLGTEHLGFKLHRSAP